MKNWNIDKAQAKFPELVRDCVIEPQFIYENNQAVAVVLNIQSFRSLTTLKPKNTTTDVSTLINELESIHEPRNSEKPDITERADRINHLLKGNPAKD